MNQKNDGAGPEKKGSLPLHVQMLDIVFDQIDRAVPLAASTLKDLQTVYLGGMRIAFKAGEVLEERSKLRFAVVHRVAQVFENIVPTAMKAQLEMAEAFVASTRSGLRAIRKNIAGNG